MKITALVGPTSSGKSAIIRALYSKADFDLFNLDSLQIYSYFKIGTGRSDLFDKSKSYFYGFLDPTDNITAQEYVQLVLAKIKLDLEMKRHILFEGGSISFLKELTKHLNIKLMGMRPENEQETIALINARVDCHFPLLKAEVEQALIDGYRDTFVMKTPVVYAPVVDLVDGLISEERCQEVVKENLLKMHRKQLLEYSCFDVSWSISKENLVNTLFI